MNSIYFFIAQNELTTQDVSKRYGPVDETKFRATSLFNGSVSSSEPMAYAVTAGKIFIVNQTGHLDRVNLFLKPDSNIIGFPPVKYFVYRGLLKSDFLNKDDDYITVKPVDADTDSKLIKNIRKGLDPIKAVECYDSITDENFLIDDLYISEDNQFALVGAGDSIGRFDTIESELDFGFEIILHEQCFNPSIKFARNELTVINIPTSTTGLDYSFRNKTLAFIDPAAYYGFFSFGKEKKDQIIDGYSVGTNNSSGTKSLSKSLIYDQIIKYFATKNSIYIDIRDKWGYPLNWFTENPQLIKITGDNSVAAGSTSINYSSTFGFPLHIKSSGFSNYTTGFESHRYFHLRISLSSLGNSTPLILLHCGYWDKSFPNLRSDIKFQKPEVVSDWTEDVKVIVFAAIESGSTIPVATYIRLQLLEYFDADAYNSFLPKGDFYTQEVISFTNLFSPNSLRAPNNSDITVINKKIK